MWNISHFSKAGTWKSIRDFNTINTFYHCKYNLLFSCLFSLELEWGKKCLNSVFVMWDSWVCLLGEDVFPPLSRDDSLSDFDESGLGRWPRSKSEHLDSARPDRFSTYTCSEEKCLMWTRLQQIPLPNRATQKLSHVGKLNLG